MSIEQLRDEFACAALGGLIGSNPSMAEESVAVLAYRYADAMLFQRNAYCPNCSQRYDVTKGYIVHESGCTYGWQADLPTGEL